ncbi:MAG: CDP-diacylglycerol--glycerol-3-phosphate 3-phosphatidyltransferase [Calditrichaeota bacterium]|nr:MAG: CDP-diacylglycerol--glycerol-3-phosphate 3-phosphatidyltransferase [Calditrichota bacterium]
MVRHIPNILTVFRMVITPVFIFAFLQHGITWKLITLFIFVFSTITDKVDGHLARKYGWETSLGKFLDPLADKVLITSAFVCLIFFNYIDVWMVAVIVVRDVVVTWLRSYGLKVGRPVHTMEIARWKTGVQTVAIYIALVFIIFKAFLEHYHIHSVIPQMLDNWRVIWIAMLITTLFTLVTGILYIMENRHLFSKNPA